MASTFKYKFVPKLLLKHRTKLHLSQAELADKIGIKGNGKAQFFSRIEKGYVSLPIQYWKSASKVLGITLEDLIIAHLEDERLRIKQSLF